MKFKLICLILFVFMLVTLAIFYIPHLATQSAENEQIKLTKQLVDSFNKAFIDTKENVKLFAHVLQENFDLSKPCDLPSENNTLSSIYYPKSAILNHRTNCFVKATKKLEPLWQKFFRDTGFISWVYAFDSDSKVKRILPAGNVKTLFGENLIFDSFLFYKNAVTAYPSTGWTDVREDINGTGRIMVVTQAVKLPLSKRFVSMSADIRINQILKNLYSEMRSYLQKNNPAHFFIFAYSKEGDNRIVIADFSNDLTLWMSIKPHNNRALNVLPEEEKQLNDLEYLANINPLKIEKQTVYIRQEKYFCTQGRVPEVPIFFLVCSGN